MFESIESIDCIKWVKIKFDNFFRKMLDLYSVDVHNNQQVAALPQLDRGSDYESERHRFESYTPHQLKLKASGDGGFSFT